MESRESDRVGWGGRLWLLALIALVLTVVIVAVIFPRPLAYVSPAPTAPPWTSAPGLYTIPTAVLVTPTAVAPPATPKP